MGQGIQLSSSAAGLRNPHQLQHLQEQILRSKEEVIDSSSEGTLSRCDNQHDGVDNAMEIVQGYTPSGLATSSAAKGALNSSAQEQ